VTRSAPDKFLYVFKTGPSRARKRAATAGRDACLPLRFAALPARPLAWRARANRVPGRRQQNSPSTLDTLPVAPLARKAGDPCRLMDPHHPPVRGVPHRPASNHGRDGPARHASRAPPASLRDLRPLTRTAPNLRSAAIGAMREVCQCT